MTKGTVGTTQERFFSGEESEQRREKGAREATIEWYGLTLVALVLVGDALQFIHEFQRGNTGMAIFGVNHCHEVFRFVNRDSLVRVDIDLADCVTGSGYIHLQQTIIVGGITNHFRHRQQGRA